ncbi:MAG: aldo/keto reductase [Gammaproteobacteria bacterium]|nr:aldo/keto reductase [Gammaproteobacteria bacterium]
MQYRNLGSSGLKVSAIGLGTNQFGGKVDLETTKNILAAALEAGVNFIDTADIYQEGRSEEFIGQSLAGNRSGVLLATKVYGEVGEGPNDRGASRHHIMQGVEASLRRLQTDYIDLYQIHVWDEDAPIDETLRALDDLVHAGKVRYIGASNFSAWQLTWANALAELRGWNRFVSIQPHYHMLERGIEAELLPACKYFDIGILPYFPLAGGFLTGKYVQGEPAPAGSRGESSQYVQRYMTPENYAKVKKLTAFAQEHEHSLNDLAHAWLLAQPQISSVISGATRVEHVQANAAAGEGQLTEEELSQVNEILDDNLE